MRILITGKDGLCGSALQVVSKQFPQFEYIFVGRKNYDLTKEEQVKRMYEDTKPDYVISSSAKVGGIFGNQASHGDYFRENILMNTHVIHYAKEFNVKKLLVFSSVCACYDGHGILKEDTMHDGPTYSLNFAYGFAKRAVDIQIRAYKLQYGIKNYCSVIPTNILGVNDLYDRIHGHVVPSLIHKLYRAKHFGEPFVVAGTGAGKREFIDSEDVALGCLNLLLLDTIPERIIFSSGYETSIKNVVELLCQIVNYPFKSVVWDISKSDGQLSRPSDTSLFQKTLPDVANNLIPLVQSLEKSYRWFEENYPNCRGVRRNT